MNNVPQVIISPVVLLSLASGILLIGSFLYAFIFFFDRKRLYLSIALNGFAGFMYIFNEVIVTSLSVSGHGATGMQFHRIQALSAAFFLFSLPFHMENMLEMSPVLHRVTKWTYRAGLGIFLIIAAAAFIMPELFVGLYKSPGSVLTPWNLGRGTPGLLYRFRDSLFVPITFYCTFLMVYELLRNRRQFHVVITLAGILMAIISGIFDINIARKEISHGLYSMRIYSLFGFGMSAFIISAMLGVMKQYIDRSRGIERAMRLESLGIMAGGIAHDFNNILTGILGNATLLREFAETGVEQKNLIIEIEKAAARARDLSTQLLTFSRGGSPIKDIASLPDLVSGTARFILRGSNISTNFSFAPDLWNALIDENQISQVIQNIIINAREAMPEGGTIEIDARNLPPSERPPGLETGDYVSLRIRDYGMGIPGTVLSRIFDPYFTTKISGSGLGLSICWSIVHRHDGDLQVKSKVGEGTVFTIILPAVRTRGELKANDTAQLPALRGKILFMDDEISIRTLVAHMMKKMGLACEIVEDGESAIKAYINAVISGDPFDLIILDLTVPGGMGGKEALQQIYRFDPLVKAVVTSGYIDGNSMDDLAMAGFIGIIPKPFGFRDMQQTLGGILGKTGKTS